MSSTLAFSTELLTRREPAGIDVRTTLEHFAIVTFLADPTALRPQIHERFELDTVEVDGQQRALVSVVPFLDRDFRFARYPWLRWSFGQTNYRVYVTDKQSGEHVAWFFGTILDSATVALPQLRWKLPWHRGRIRFDCRYDPSVNRYTRYRMSTSSKWAPADLQLADTGQPVECLEGFPDLESGLVLLTHPMKGFFYRRDGQLGTYSIWHGRMQPTVGRVLKADFPLFNRLGISYDSVHSILIQPKIDFTVYLPPRCC